MIELSSLIFLFFYFAILHYTSLLILWVSVLVLGTLSTSIKAEVLYEGCNLIHWYLLGSFLCSFEWSIWWHIVLLKLAEIPLGSLVRSRPSSPFQENRLLWRLCIGRGPIGGIDRWWGGCIRWTSVYKSPSSFWYTISHVQFGCSSMQLWNNVHSHFCAEAEHFPSCFLW